MAAGTRATTKTVKPLPTPPSSDNAWSMVVLALFVGLVLGAVLQGQMIQQHDVDGNNNHTNEQAFDLKKWVAYLESQATVEQNFATQTPGVATIYSMFQTPILHVNVRDLGISNEESKQLNTALSARVLAEHDMMKTELASIVSVDSVQSDGAHDLNQLFYNHQTQGGAWDRMMQQSEFQYLMSTMQQLVDIYLANIGVPDVDINARSNETEVWATVHNHGANHLMHSHPGSLVSAVYYARVPDGAGDIAFQDPRGSLPPFDSRFNISPKSGDLIMFPSWLLHQVLATSGDSERISIAANFIGDWSLLAGIKSKFTIQLSTDHEL